MATVIRKFVALFQTKADTKGLDSFGKSVDSVGGSLKKLIGGVAALGGARAALEFGKQAEQAENLASAFQTLGGTRESLNSLRNLTRGLVPDSELQKMANMASLFGITQEQVASLGEIAVGASVATGESVEKMFGDILTAASRQSPLIADNLGLVVKKADAYAAQAAVLGKAVKDLTSEEKGLAFTNALIAGGTRQQALAQNLAGTEVAKTASQMANLKTQLKKLLLVALRPVFGFLGDIAIPRLNMWIQQLRDSAKVGGKLSKAVMVLRKSMLALAPVLVVMTSAKIVSGFTGLFQIVVKLSGAFKVLRIRALMAKAAVLAIPILIALLVLALEDLATFLRGGDSLIGRFVERFKTVDGPLGNLARGIDNAKPALQALMGELMAMIPVIIAIGLEVFKVVKKEIMPLFFELAGLAKDIFDDLGSDLIRLFKTVAAMMARLFRQAIPVIKQVVAVVVPILISIATGFLKVWVRVNSAIIRGIRAILPIVNAVLSFIIQMFQKFSPFIEEIISGLITFVEMAFNELGPIIMSLFETLEPIITGVIDGLKLAFEEILPVVISVFTGIISVVVAVVGFFVGVKDSFLAFWTGLVGFFGGIAKGVLMVWQAVIGAVIKIFAPLFSVVQKAIDVANKLGAGINVNLNKSLKGVEKKLTGAGNIDSTIAGAQATAAAGAPQSQTNNTSVGQVQVNVQGNPNQGLSASDLGAAAKAGVLEATQMREAEREFASG